MDVDGNIIIYKSFLLSTPISASAASSCGWAKRLRLPLHLRLQSAFDQHDLIHPPCTTVWLIITLLFLIRLPPPYHRKFALLTVVWVVWWSVLQDFTLLCFLVLFLRCSQVWEGVWDEMCRVHYVSDWAFVRVWACVGVYKWERRRRRRMYCQKIYTPRVCYVFCDPEIFPVMK